MRLHVRVIMLVAVMTTLVASSSEAQDRRKHDGFWWAFGLGGGWSSWQWSLGNSGLRGAAAYFRLGGTVNEHVLFGGEAITLWREGQPGQDLQRVNVTASAFVYPSADGGLFFKGGFGLAESEMTGTDGEGIGLTLGSGFDLRLARNLYVTPNVDVLVQLFEQDTNVSLLFTMGFTWH